MERTDEIVIIKAKKTLGERIQPYMYLLPALLVSTVFMFWPFIQTIFRSLYLTDSFGQMSQFLGLRNYAELFASKSFWNAMMVSFQFVLIVVVFGVAVGLIAAMLCQRSFPGIRFFSTSYAMPMAIASAGMAMIFQVMLNPTVGIVKDRKSTRLNSSH